MNTFNLNEQRIIDSILAAGIPPLAAEAGAELGQTWITKELHKDLTRTVVAVECGFVVRVDEATVVIGVQDLLTEEDGIVGNEHKSTKEKTRYWNSDAWFESIVNGSQLGVYALALREGTYYEHGSGKEFKPGVAEPRIRVRAISKSAPPELWPLDGKDVVKFAGEEIDVVKRALQAKGAAIRAMRNKGSLPWQLPGIWCTNQFRRTCGYHEDCLAKRVPEGWATFDPNDPAFKLALPHIGDTSDPNLVVLSASSYASYSECLEAGRRNAMAGNREESGALATGTALHAALADYYEQLREWQNLSSSATNSLDIVP